jgi:hypothetical protein
VKKGTLSDPFWPDTRQSTSTREATPAINFVLTVRKKDLIRVWLFQWKPQNFVTVHIFVVSGVEL